LLTQKEIKPAFGNIKGKHLDFSPLFDQQKLFPNNFSNPDPAFFRKNNTGS